MSIKTLKLKSGRVVLESQFSNGAKEVMMADDGKMSEAEWEEYCTAVVECLKEAAAQS